MTDWVAVAKRDEIAPGECHAVEIDDQMIAVFNLDGEFYAIDNICTHAHAELCDGMIIDGQITCPLHGARFNIRTGEVTAPPAYEPLGTYPARVNGDIVEVNPES
jgi:3-phenylpropionate/trans-cinnamate dioxygenase ferredoxin component